MPEKGNNPIKDPALLFVLRNRFLISISAVLSLIISLFISTELIHTPYCSCFDLDICFCSYFCASILFSNDIKWVKGEGNNREIQLNPFPFIFLSAFICYICYVDHRVLIFVFVFILLLVLITAIDSPSSDYFDICNVMSVRHYKIILFLSINVSSCLFGNGDCLKTIVFPILAIMMLFSGWGWVPFFWF